MKTFIDVGAKEGLEGKILERYVEYMLKRWKEREEIQCRTGYAAEWAQRFKGGDEYMCSDSEGQAILEEVNRRTNAPS
ncbi:hypothetical protein LCGC14_0940370 [marine sediment metagenome]|uniref:Uncharacterized protein n=1 Tax=marine sediment metagenome TaxID=412755 RepID=A0A0F9NPZ7_9ZZZZ